ncbi:MAG: potassium/proton antiporter, partial [Gemmatimonadota bacterium]|nr:potassium/proton antiporter [Gemmatimonadota bacterium]
AGRIFDIVFFIVVVNAIVPGGTVGWVTRKLGLESSDPPSPPAALEISSTQLLRGEILSFYIDPAVAVCGIEVQEIPFPEASSALLIMRGAELIAPRGGTVLQPGDHVYLFAAPDDVGMLQLMFGRPQGD